MVVPRSIETSDRLPGIVDFVSPAPELAWSGIIKNSLPRPIRTGHKGSPPYGNAHHLPGIIDAFGDSAESNILPAIALRPRYETGGKGVVGRWRRISTTCSVLLMSLA